MVQRLFSLRYLRGPAPGPGCVRAVRTVLTSSCEFIKFFRLEKIN